MRMSSRDGIPVLSSRNLSTGDSRQIAIIGEKGERKHYLFQYIFLQTHVQNPVSTYIMREVCIFCDVSSETQLVAMKFDRFFRWNNSQSALTEVSNLPVPLMLRYTLRRDMGSADLAEEFDETHISRA